jgi:hypothetical protein
MSAGLKRTIVFSGLLVVLAGAAATGWAPFGDAIRERLNRRRFDPVAWQGQKSISNEVRIRMVDDLLRRHRFEGMTRQQVTAILGEPDKTEYFREWDLVYWLGPERGFISIDSEWLDFRLDGLLKVRDYRIVTD